MYLREEEGMIQIMRCVIMWDIFNLGIYFKATFFLLQLRPEYQFPTPMQFVLLP